MAADQVPVVVGVGDIVNRSLKIEDALEPSELMLRAVKAALSDAGLSSPQREKLQSDVDSIDVVPTWTWPYRDLPGILSEKLQIDPGHKSCASHGGNQPAKLLDGAARRISQGVSKVAVVTGGEALASLNACLNAKMLPPGWTKPVHDVESVLSPTKRSLGSNIGGTHSIGTPIHVYPLYENGFRAYRGQSITANNEESAQLYADFAKVAEKHPYAWNYGKPSKTKESIMSISERNRMICYPYPLLMNAFNTVNLAAACILTSVEYARSIDISEEKWIYPLGGAGTQDSEDFWQRPNFYSSPAISRSLDAGLRACGLSKDEIDLFDLYSCFPIVPKLVCQHLGFPLSQASRPLTLLGGLTSFGGAGNNYSMHAITEMVRQLRSGPGGRHGLILANGGLLTYQHVICLSSRPRSDGLLYPQSNPLPQAITEVPGLAVDAQAEGEATIEVGFGILEDEYHELTRNRLTQSNSDGIDVPYGAILSGDLRAMTIDFSPITETKPRYDVSALERMNR